MQTLSVKLPTVGVATSAALFYEHAYSRGAHRLDFLHLIRQRGNVFLSLANRDALEEDYWNALDADRKSFAAACAATIGNIDILIDPPSTRGYHRPYLSGFKQIYNVYWVSFEKSVQAGSNDIEALRKSIKVFGDSHKHAQVNCADMHNILIVDDVFATGTTAAVTVEVLKQKSLPKDVRFYIAAPLLIPKNIMDGPHGGGRP